MFTTLPGMWQINDHIWSMKTPITDGRQQNGERKHSLWITISDKNVTTFQQTLPGYTTFLGNSCFSSFLGGIVGTTNKFSVRRIYRVSHKKWSNFGIRPFSLCSTFFQTVAGKIKIHFLSYERTIYFNPCVQLKSNFGGTKNITVLEKYHLGFYNN